MKLLIAVTILALVKLSSQADYCNKALCKKDKHVACNGLTSLSPSCGAKAEMVVLDDKLKTLIVDKHNQLRSKIASGKQAPYPQAARMATMQWNAELADIAVHNARSCNFAHDKCRNTNAFNAAGQNLAIKSYYGQTFTDTELINGFIDAWYDEYSDANPSFVAKYPENYSGPMIGHFTQVVSASSTQVGCALVSYETAPWLNKYFVCNYARTNIIGLPVYEAGNSCSKCTEGCNPNYPGLCNPSEPIDPRVFRITVTVLALVELSTQTNYCDKALCGPKKHVSCNGLTSLAPSCGSEAKVIPMDDKLKALILNKHNEFRSKIATGKQAPYLPAARMTTMLWDTELENLAGANAMSCNFGHDQCRNTDAFNAAGQNIAIKSYYGKTYTDEEIITGFIDAWYNEFANANQAIIDKYPKDYKGPMMGHFTQVVSDRAAKVGCSLVQYKTDGKWINKLMTCDYSITNVVGQPIYEAGNACSKCTKGCNPQYPGLCNPSEPINARI
ncbi:uncharacterized protein LOC129774168 [Toxorhynchites rutilus septentrionalis]|uniref:uncharacterized protein LOC129774168 n=1 Tax=Toxorhynchites rutilus septentrionalis TaxID=329112 RepID=UPI002479D71A|nr:uncharacterized protein LOC129774168 [Toxorhynchites rutilus septentrionalis]